MDKIKKAFNNLISNFHLIIFIMLAIFPKINIINVPGTYVGIRLSDFVVFFYTIYIIYNFIKKKELYNNKYLKKIIIGFGVYLIACLISTIYGFLKEYISILMGMLYLIRKLEYFIFIFIGYDMIRKVKNKEYAKNKFLTAMNFVILFHFLFCILQFVGVVGSFNRSEYIEGLIQNRICSTFNGAYELTAFLLLTLPFYVYMIFSKKYSSAIGIFYTFLIGIMILISESRTSLVIYVFIILLMLLIYNKKNLKKVLVISGTAIAILIALILFLKLLGFNLIDRFLSLNIENMINVTEYAWENKDFEEYVNTGSWYKHEDLFKIAANGDYSYFVRISHWSQMLDGFLKSPLIGTGLSISQTAADGNYVRIIVESGIIGLVLWLVVQYFIIISIKEKKYLNESLRFSLITLFLGGIFIDVFEASKVMSTFYYILGVTLAYNEFSNIKLKKIKNVVVINDFNYIEGGASKVAIETACVLKEKIENVYYFSAVNKTEANIEGIKYISTNQKEALKEKNKIIGIINGLYNFKSRKTLKKVLLRLEPEETVVHIHGWTKALSSSVFDVSFNMGFKVVLTCHDYFTACPNGGYFNYNANKICQLKPLSLKCIKCNCDSRNYYFKIYRLVRHFIQNEVVSLNRRIKYVIGISDLNLNVLKKTLNDDVIIKKILNPIDISKASEKVNVLKNKQYLYIGRVTREKGVEIFCKEMTELHCKGVVVGDGPDLEILRKKYKTISFLGWKNKYEIVEQLKKTRALIFPSLWYEGAPLTPLEAMSYGVPCLVSNCSSAVEYIDDNGVIFDPYVKNDFKRKFRILNKKIEKYSIKAYGDVDKYVGLNYVNELIEFYEVS